MSTIWTPGGERPVSREPAEPVGAPEIDEAEMEARLDELRAQLANTPVDGIAAQMAYQLFEVAALHLSVLPPNLLQAQLAIDAMAALVEGLGERLGEHAAPLRDGLSQIRMAFVQIKSAGAAPPPPTDQGDPPPPRS